MISAISGSVQKKRSIRPENENILRCLELAREMLFLADRGDLQRMDEGCGVLFGMIRDEAYRIMQAAQREKAAHQRRGIWEHESTGNSRSTDGRLSE